MNAIAAHANEALSRAALTDNDRSRLPQAHPERRTTSGSTARREPKRARRSQHEVVQDQQDAEVSEGQHHVGEVNPKLVPGRECEDQENRAQQDRQGPQQ